MTHLSPTPVAAAKRQVYSRFDEGNYKALGKSEDVDARLLWRAKHCTMVGLKAKDALKRIFRVPSTRDEGAYYLVNLNTKDCSRFSSDGTSECPDKRYQHKQECVHFRAALEAERVFLEANLDNRLIFARIDEEPVQHLFDRDKRRSALSGAS